MHVGYPQLNLGLLALLLFHLEEQRAVDPRQNTTEGDGGTDQRIQLFVPTDGQLEVTRGDTLDLEVLGGVSGKLEDFGSQVFEDSSDIHGSYGQLTSISRGGRSVDSRSNIPLAPTRILFWVLFFKKRLTRPQGNYGVISQPF